MSRFPQGSVPLQEKVDEEAKVEEVEMERDLERARSSPQPRSHQTGSASCHSLCCAVLEFLFGN